MLRATRATNRVGVVACVLVLIIAALLLASCSEPAQDGAGSREDSGAEAAGTSAEAVQTSLVGHNASVVGSGTPTLVDLGSDTCVPCKMMEPILEELAAEFEGRLHVVFINTNEDRDAGARYGIRVIPTQIFFAPDGSELFRHQGFLSREDIMAKWSELGYEFDDAPGEA